MIRVLHVTLSSVEALANVQGQGGISHVQSPDLTSLTRIHGLLSENRLQGGGAEAGKTVMRLLLSPRMDMTTLTRMGQGR